VPNNSPSSSGLRAFVGHLGSETTEAEVYAAFALVGVPLADVELVFNHATHASRGFAFVNIAERPGEPVIANLIFEQMRRAMVHERAVQVHPLRSPAHWYRAAPHTGVVPPPATDIPGKDRAQR
jgi:hypothetical protein